jgi:hypothetical protein
MPLNYGLFYPNRLPKASGNPRLIEFGLRGDGSVIPAKKPPSKTTMGLCRKIVGATGRPLNFLSLASGVGEHT